MENQNNLPTESTIIDNKVVEKTNTEKSLNIYTTKPSDIKLYKLNQYEFELICQGSGNSVLTSLVMFIWGLFVSFFLVFLTTNFTEKYSTSYVIILTGLLVTFILGICLGVFNFYSKSDANKRIEEIKSRKYTVEG